MMRCSVKVRVGFAGYVWYDTYFPTEATRKATGDLTFVQRRQVILRNDTTPYHTSFHNHKVE